MAQTNNKMTFISLAGATIMWILGANVAVSGTQPETYCTASTARQMEQPVDLCGCETVTTRMIRVVQRRSDFGDILSETSQFCPLLAAVLSDLPTASNDEGTDNAGAEEASGYGRDDSGDDGDDGDDSGDDGDDSGDDGDDSGDDGDDSGDDGDDDGDDGDDDGVSGGCGGSCPGFE